MKSEQLQQIIKDKNDKREREAVYTADQLIEQIVGEQAKIEHAKTNIDNLRKQLAALTIDQIDPTTILGEA